MLVALVTFGKVTDTTLRVVESNVRFAPFTATLDQLYLVAVVALSAAQVSAIDSPAVPLAVPVIVTPGAD